MKKYVNTKRVCLLTFISFIVSFLFIYVFSMIAPKFYTGWDMYTNKNILCIFIDIIFMILLSINIIGTILCIIYISKACLNKLNKIIN